MRARESTWLAGPGVAHCLGGWVGFGADDGALRGYGRVWIYRAGNQVPQESTSLENTFPHRGPCSLRAYTMLYTVTEVGFTFLFDTLPTTTLRENEWVLNIEHSDSVSYKLTSECEGIELGTDGCLVGLEVCKCHPLPSGRIGWKGGKANGNLRLPATKRSTQYGPWSRSMVYLSRYLF